MFQWMPSEEWVALGIVMIVSFVKYFAKEKSPILRLAYLFFMFSGGAIVFLENKYHQYHNLDDIITNLLWISLWMGIACAFFDSYKSAMRAHEKQRANEIKKAAFDVLGLLGGLFIVSILIKIFL